MSVGFKAVQWNRQKYLYDGILIAAVALFIGAFMTTGALRNPPADLPAWINLRIKAFGTCAFVMLTIILMFVIHELQLRQERLVLDTEAYVDDTVISNLQSR
jgi:hypothetical protein